MRWDIKKIRYQCYGPFIAFHFKAAIIVLMQIQSHSLLFKDTDDFKTFKIDKLNEKEVEYFNYVLKDKDTFFASHEVETTDGKKYRVILKFDHDTHSLYYVCIKHDKDVLFEYGSRYNESKSIFKNFSIKFKKNSLSIGYKNLEASIRNIEQEHIENFKDTVYDDKKFYDNFKHYFYIKNDKTDKYDVYLIQYDARGSKEKLSIKLNSKEMVHFETI